MLGLAADHLDVIQFVGRYAQQHPSSRTTTELLFLLDELAEANRGAFALLMRHEHRRPHSDGAHRARRTCSSPGSCSAATTAWTRERGLDQAKALDAHYDGVRLAILSTIVETSPNGYGAADARFLAGRLLWDRSDIAGAVELWRGMGTDERTTYATVRAEIRPRPPSRRQRGRGEHRARARRRARALAARVRRPARPLRLHAADVLKGRSEDRPLHSSTHRALPASPAPRRRR